MSVVVVMPAFPIAQQGDPPKVSRLIARFGERLAGHDVGMFFFAGHGIQIRGKNYLLPVDAQIASENSVRAEAVDALRLFAHEPQAIAPQLLSSMRDGSPRVRFRAIELLEKFVADMGPMIPAIRVAIANAFHDSSELVQTRAVKASGTIAQWTERADPRLVNALFDADGDTRLAAVLALAATHHDPEAIDALRFRLGDERADVRVAACHALIACGEDAGAVLATLIHELGDSDTAVQLEAMRAIKLLGASATSALEDVREKTADSNPEVRAAAMRLVSALELA